MFDIGFSELSLLAVVGLLILGPERLPVVARVLGGYLRKARRTWNTVKAEIESELAASEIRNTIQQPLDALDELRLAANKSVALDPVADTEKKPKSEGPVADTEKKPKSEDHAGSS